MVEFSPRAYEIVLVDDHPLVRRGIKKIIESHTGFKVVMEFDDGLEALEFLKKRLPHLVILDISMPHLGGIEATRRIKAGYPGIKVLILTLHNRREYVTQAWLAGADGYLVKDEINQELLPAIETIKQGGTYISPFLEG